MTAALDVRVSALEDDTSKTTDRIDKLATTVDGNQSKVLEEFGLAHGQFENIRNEFDYVHDEFEYMHDQFGYMHGQFGYMHDQFGYMHGQFEYMHGQFDHMHRKFSIINGRLDEQDAHLVSMGKMLEEVLDRLPSKN